MEDEPLKTYFSNRENHEPFYLTQCDSITRTHSVSIVTDFIWKKVVENSFQEGTDTIVRKKLCRITFYIDEFHMHKSKFFDYKLDRHHKSLFLTGITHYEYDSLGRVLVETTIADDKYHYFILEEDGKYREEIKDGRYSTNSSKEYN